MSSHKTAKYNETLALAAVMQSASLVNQVAFTGKIKDEDCFNASINSVLKLNQDDVIDIYGSVKNLLLGLTDLEFYLKREVLEPNFNHKVKYMTQLNRLGNLLSGSPDMGGRIAESIKMGKVSANSVKPSAKVVENLAKAYYENFSALPTNRRIVVMGKKEYLGIDKNVVRIRALLLAGVRAALLWRNNGGGMLTLFFQRKQMIADIQEIKRTI